MKILVLGLILIGSSSLFQATANASDVITLDCKAETPFTGKFSGTLEVTKIANSAEPRLENETGSVSLSLTRLETEALPDGTARQIVITNQLVSNEFQASSEFVPAGQLFVHDATIVTLSLPESKVSVRVIPEMSGVNATVILDGARYTANCQLK